MRQEQEALGRELGVQVNTQVLTYAQWSSHLQIESLDATVMLIRTRMRDTVKLQYQELPAQFLMTLEVDGPKDRELLARVVERMGLRRAQAYQAVALGLLRILVEEKHHMERRPLYARCALTVAGSHE
jgi:hypothetical protein